MPYHIPALLPQALHALDIKPQGVYVDVTYGGGGHSRAILENLNENGRLFAFDQDADAVRNAVSDPRFTMIHANFRYLTNFMAFYDVDGVDGLLADLGVSFHHFDDPERGFSFRWDDSPLDMRMNPGATLTAAGILEEADTDRLTSIFKTYGELKNARLLANAIVKARNSGRSLSTAADLRSAVATHLNPAQEKKELACIFQALRIVVNDELGVLRMLLNSAARVIRPGGRIAIITYHSLEDRLVKNFFKSGNMEGETEKDFFGNIEAPFRPLGNKPIVPDSGEVELNPRSRSAKLRIAVRR